MEYIITAIWSLIEICGIFTFLSAFLPLQKKKKHCVISIVVVWGIMFAYCALGLGNFVRQLVTIGVAIAWSVYLFSARWYRHVLYVILAYTFCAIMDVVVCYGASFALGISYTELVWRKLLYVAVGTLAKLLYLFLAYLVYRGRNIDSAQPEKGKWTLLTAAFPAASAIVLVIIFSTYQKDGDLSAGAVLSGAVLAASNIAILYLIRIMELNSAKEMEMALLSQQMAIQADSITALEKSYRSQRAATHEFRHHLETIQELLARNKQEAVCEYVEKLQGTQTERLLCVNSHHAIVDAVLNQKYQMAMEYGIEMQFQVNDLSGIQVDTKALVVLLSNLLDNAIEACQKLSLNRMVSCTVLLNDELFIAVKNTSLPVQIVDGTITTTKIPREEHGYGLTTVKHVLNQLGAEYTIHYEQGFFQFAAEIPNITK